MKTKLFACLIAFIFIAGTSAYAQMFQSGSFSADGTVRGYSLNAGSGERTITIEITFEKPFDGKPTVAVSVNTIEADKDSNLRYSAKPVFISRDGFVVQIRTWADSKIHAIGGSWVAHGGKE
jgi:hypothetical protein